MQPANAAAPAATDLTGLEQLRQRAAHADPGALKEAAAQFDALFIGMMLKSARAASLGKGIFDSQASSQYLELMDDQVALELARKGGLGFGKILLEQISPRGCLRCCARCRRETRSTRSTPTPTRPRRPRRKLRRPVTQSSTSCAAICPTR